MQRGVEAFDEDTAGQRALGEGKNVGVAALEALMGGKRQESGVEEEGAEARQLVGHRNDADMQQGVEAFDEDTAGQRRALGERQDVETGILQAPMGGKRHESGVKEEGAEARMLA